MSEAQASYPHVFRVPDHNWVVGSAVVISLVATGVVVFGARAVLLGTPSVLWVAAPVMVAAACYAWTVALSRAVVWPDRIEVSNGFRKQTLKAVEIRGYRRPKADRLIALVPLQGPPVWVPSSIWSVRTLVPWFAGLPDLTLEERRNIEQRIASNPRYGATHIERQLQKGEAKRWALLLNWVGAIIGIGCFFWPFEQNLAVAAASAATALSLAYVATSQGLVRIDMADDEDDPRPALWIGAMPPGLFVYTKSAGGPVEASLLSACLAAVAYVSLLASSDEQLRSKPATALLVAFGVAAYFWAVLKYWTV